MNTSSIPKVEIEKNDWGFSASISPPGLYCEGLVMVSSHVHQGKWLPADISWGWAATDDSTDVIAGVVNFIAALQEAIVIATEFNRTHDIEMIQTGIG